MGKTEFIISKGKIINGLSHLNLTHVLIFTKLSNPHGLCLFKSDHSFSFDRSTYSRNNVSVTQTWRDVTVPWRLDRNISETRSGYDHWYTGQVSDMSRSRSCHVTANHFCVTKTFFLPDYFPLDYAYLNQTILLVMQFLKFWHFLMSYKFKFKNGFNH